MTQALIYLSNREKNSLSHVATVAKFLAENKAKSSLKKWIMTVLQTSSILINFI